MNYGKRIVAFVATILSLLVLFFTATNVDAARMDMVDVSNHNGSMTVANFTDMRDNYGVKAVVTKISEGSSYKDAYAANNIKTAQAAGLYISGYHFARYNTVAQAKAEADFAAQTAKADGLPAGAVLVADVESTEQQFISKDKNDANNTAFMNEVAKYGYRSDIYTMGSWVGAVMTVDKGWVAEYPNDATDLYLHPNAHGWQWTSSYNFGGSYGNFDVSQLYDNFFTSYQTPQTFNPGNTNSNSTTNNVSKGVIKVADSSSSYVPLMALQSDGSMSRVTNRALANNTPWVTDQTRTVNGITYHRVATNEWVDAKYIIG
ncbi:GH25 family lysozyme [Companilactobacillus halodurans]|uniref:1,4-beta-N-acetylmuramidase n=1 Tax=Companilactobacillus halodurans TaxID=2584183 RepID=A0A5P0ZZH6_9LACO|nr:GH25 family lysozyme [Companilactobacillus halodurans]MQS75200.1 1,4-beta-N-acetylmuramidase [Companilactobacillus halodurans]MQS98493.1 1,4-beta-N-acetylmuramidase [Companilactobacillus halodurans]